MVRYVLIAAGGTGSRMGTTLPKQFLPLAGKTVMEHTLQAFLNAAPGFHFIVTLPAVYLHLEKDIRALLPAAVPLTVIAGGETRFHSVQNGLQCIPETDALVFVHDAARCLVSAQLIHTCEAVALEKGNAIPAAPIHDSLRLVQEDGRHQPLNRENVRAIQTPQTFRVSLLKKAYARSWQPAFTDEATVAEAAGIPIHLVPGETENIKVTTPFDLALAETLLAKRNI